MVLLGILLLSDSNPILWPVYTIMCLWPTSLHLSLSPLTLLPPSHPLSMSKPVSPCPQNASKTTHSPSGLMQSSPQPSPPPSVAGEKRKGLGMGCLQRNPLHKCTLTTLYILQVSSPTPLKICICSYISLWIYIYSILVPLLKFPVYFLSHVCRVAGT